MPGARGQPSAWMRAPSAWFAGEPATATEGRLATARGRAAGDAGPRDLLGEVDLQESDLALDVRVDSAGCLRVR
jgi:hypothetical protein